MPLDLTDMGKLVLIGQLHASQLQAIFVMKWKNVRNNYFGIVTEISPKGIIMKTVEKYQMFQVQGILSINMKEEIVF